MYYNDQPKILTNDDIISASRSAGALTPINGVSTIYDFVSTMDAVDLLRQEGWLPISIMESGTRVSHRAGFQKHLIRFVQGSNLDLGEEHFQLSLVNSHDRSSAFKMIATIFRKTCSNGLMTSYDWLNFTHKHIGFDETEFKASAIKIANSAGDVAKEIEMMKAIPLSEEERLLFANSAHELVHDEPAKAAVRPEQYLIERRYDDEGKDLYTTYNVIQENVMRGGIETEKNLNGKTVKRRTRAVRSLDRNIRLNQAIHRLAVEMKKLKG